MIAETCGQTFFDLEKLSDETLSKFRSIESLQAPHSLVLRLH